jgi:hypothetical protein
MWILVSALFGSVPAVGKKDEQMITSNWFMLF